MIGLAIAAAGPVRAATVGPDSAAVGAAQPDTAGARSIPTGSTLVATPADTTGRDDTALEAQAAAILAAPGGTRRTASPPGRFDSPHWVMMRSLLIPGWGQAHNQAWVKAGVIGGTDLYLRIRVVKDHQELNDLGQTADATGAELSSANAEVAAAQAEVEAAQAELDAAIASGDPVRIAAAQAALRAAEQALLAANLAQQGASNAYNTAVIAYNALLDDATNRRWFLATAILYSMIDAYVDAHFRNFDLDLKFDPGLSGGSGKSGMRLQLRWTF